MNKKRIISSVVCFVLGLLLVFFAFGLKRPVSSSEQKVFYAYRDGKDVVLYIENSGLYPEGSSEDDLHKKIKLHYYTSSNQKIDEAGEYTLSGDSHLNSEYFCYKRTYNASWEVTRLTYSSNFECEFYSDSGSQTDNKENCSIIWIDDCVDFELEPQTDPTDRNVRINVIYKENTGEFIKKLFTESEFKFAAKICVGDSFEKNADISDDNANQFVADFGNDLKPGSSSVKMKFTDNSNGSLVFDLEDKFEIKPSISNYVIKNSDNEVVYDLDPETIDSNFYCDGEYTVSFACDFNEDSFENISYSIYDMTAEKEIGPSKNNKNFSNKFNSNQYYYVNHKLVFITKLECDSGDIYYVCNGEVLTKIYNNDNSSLSADAIKQLKQNAVTVSNHIACLSVSQFFANRTDGESDKNRYAIKDNDKVAFLISAPDEQFEITYLIDNKHSNDSVNGTKEFEYGTYPIVGSEPDEWYKLSSSADYRFITEVSGIKEIGYLEFDITIVLQEGTDRFDELSIDASERVKEYPELKLNSPSISAESKTLGETDTIKLVFYQDNEGSPYYNEKLTVDYVENIAGNKTVTSEKGLTAKYKSGEVDIELSELNSEDDSFFSDQDTIEFNIGISDEAGNHCVKSLSRTGYTYYSKLVVEASDFYVENAISNGDSYLIDDESKIHINLTANHSSLEYVVKYKYVDESGNDESLVINSGHFDCDDEEDEILLDRCVWKNTPADGEPGWSLPDQQIFNFEIELSDSAGGTAVLPCDQIYVYYSEMSVSGELQSDSDYVAANDEIKLCVESLDSNGCSSSHEFMITKVDLKCFVGDEELACIDATSEIKDFATGFDTKSECTIPMKLIDTNEQLKGKDNITVKVVYTITDRCNNSETYDDLSVDFYRPLSESITDVHIFGSEMNYLSNGLIKYSVKDGDRVLVQFESSHPLSGELVEGNEASYRLTGKIGGHEVSFFSNNRMKWYGLIKVTSELAWKDGSIIDFSIDLSDESGQQSYELTQMDTHDRVEYFIAIKASDLKFVSDNELSSYTLANDSNELTLTFTSTHYVSVNDAKIGGKDVVFGEPRIEDGICYYSHTVKVEDLDLTDNEPIEFEFTLSDSANNTPQHVTNESCGSLIYQAPISVSDTEFKSNNSISADYAIDGDLVTVSFYTPHPVDIASASVSGLAIAMTSINNDHMHWVGTYSVKNGDISDMQNLKIAITLTDASGNPSLEFGDNSIQYFAPVRVTACSVYTDNANDSSKYVIDGDNVFVKFKTNHKIDINSSNFSIAGFSVTSATETAVDDGSYEYVFSRKINNGDLTDLSAVSFGLSVTDAAGNSKVSVDKNSTLIANTITYYAPLNITASISSSGKNSGYAKNGDTITITSNANHSASVVSSSVDGRSLSSVTDANKVTSTYTIPENENSMNEGKLAATLNYTDVAGNKFSLDSMTEGSVIYDRTVPSIKVENAFTAFTSEGVSFDVTIIDKNIDSEGTCVYLNDSKKTIGDGINADGTTYTTKIATDEEGSYTIKITASDLAGNVAKELVYKVVVDKTDPKITTTSVSGNKIDIYRPGVVVSDMFKIEEDYFDEISCTVSDGTTTTEWDVDTPLMTDGKKTISVIVVDKAGNSSQLVFDLYIDGTAPNPIITDSLTNTVLATGANIFDEKASLTFKLQNLSYDPDAPDKFTKIQITCPDGNVIDLISGNYVNDAGDYAFDFTESGTYKITLEAVDDLGNSTGELSYDVTIKERPMDAVKTFVEEKTGISSENSGKLLVIIACSAGGVFVAILAVVIIIIRRKRR